MAEHGGKATAALLSTLLEHQRKSAPEPAKPGIYPADVIAKRLPNHLYIPALPGDDERGNGLELWKTENGELTVVTYSSIALLVEMCGAGQPWVSLSRAALASTCREHGARMVALDAPLPVGHRYPEPNLADMPDLEPATPLSADLLYIPARPMRSWKQDVVFELHPDQQGRLILLAYTSQAELEAGCGPHQAWVSISPDRIAEAIERSGAKGVLFNPTLAEEARHTGPVLDWKNDVRTIVGEDL